MADITNLWLFILAGWLLNLTPGPDVLYIVSNALRSGAKAGVVAAMGITAGCFVHVLAAAAGLSALLAASSTASVEQIPVRIVRIGSLTTSFTPSAAAR